MEERLWQTLPDKLDDLEDSGFTALWVPPPAKAMGSSGIKNIGYDVYDFWDLGEFNQKGTIGTKFGTRDELEEVIADAHLRDMKVYFDTVLNHRFGGDTQETMTGYNSRNAVWTQFTLLGRQAHYTQQRWGALWHDFAWNWQAFDSADRDEGAAPATLPNKSWDTVFHGDHLMGNDVDYDYQVNGAYVIREEMKAWGEWIINDLDFDGFRLDAIAHVHTAFTRDWVNHVQANTEKDVFFVGEAWVGDVGAYLNSVNTPHMKAFDFSLRNDFANDSNNALTSGNKDMRWWGGLVNSNMGDRAVTFIDNHDTSREVNQYNTPQVHNYKNQAYAYILLRDKGVPTVFARDYEVFDMAPTLKKLVQARRYFAYGPGHEYNGNTQSVYAYVREGLDSVPGTGLVMLIAGRNNGGQECFTINSRQPDTAFYDFTGNRSETVMTDGSGNGSFCVDVNENTGWSVWVPGESTPPVGDITLRMTVQVAEGQAVYFTGSASSLSNWGAGIEGTLGSGNVWEVTIPNPGNFTWKTRRGPAGSGGVTWEAGANHDQSNRHPPHQGWE